MRCAWASIEASASSGLSRPIALAVAGMNWRDPLSAGAGDRERVEVRLRHELRGEQPRRDVPALRRLRQRPRVRRRHEDGSERVVSPSAPLGFVVNPTEVVPALRVNP